MAETVRRADSPAPAQTGIATIKRALISVWDKAGLVRLASTLAGLGIEIISTGGTARVLDEAGISVTSASDLTGFPEILDGRVKTIHPAIAAAVLARGDQSEELAHYGIRPIDLVVVNLYPFEDAAVHPMQPSELVEWIDVGGVTLLRAAAKNWERVGVVSDPSQYQLVEDELTRSGELSAETRRSLASQAFARTAQYDAAIAARLSGDGLFPETLLLGYRRRELLRYGENPHQRAALYVAPSTPAAEVISGTQLQGKALSYNNLMDLSAAWDVVREFDLPAAVIIKHGTPCGAAVGADPAEAVARAIEGDALSAFGGVVAVNRPVDGRAVEALGTLFVEALIAPTVLDDARARLSARKSLRVLECRLDDRDGAAPETKLNLRSIPGGLLVQEPDTLRDAEETKVVTERAPNEREWADLQFAWLVCKHVRSNAIVLAKGRQTVGIGAGQMSRVDSVRIAVMKAENRARGAVLASDAFFPFPDGVQTAAEAGVTAIIQPGGSIRDADVIAAADAAGIAMVFTGQRHFRH